MRIVFRADASLNIGTGHVMRCLTLADELGRRGARCLFLCREHPGDLLDLIRARGHEAVGLPMGATTADKAEAQPVHAKWLGAGWREDAERTLAAIGAERPDWLVVDHYALDARWERAVRPACAHLMVIDDLADRPHDGDLLLDQNLGRGVGAYAQLTPAGCELRLGPQYALLRPEFAALRERSLLRRARPEIRHVLVAMGGVDKTDATGAALRALAQTELSAQCRVSVVIGPHAPWAARVRELASAMPRPTEVLQNTPDMAGLMAASDLAIGAAGSTSWERCCLGVPTILVALALNQRGIAAELEAAGAAIALSEAEIPTRLATVIGDLLRPGSDALARLSAAAASITDGLGAGRVAETLLAGQTRTLRARRAEAGDMWLFFGWANDAVARRFALDPRPILPAGHESWYTARLADADCRLFVVESGGGTPMGQVRLERAGAEWRISYSLCALYRGQGLGVRLLAAGLDAFRREFPAARLYGEVLPENAASLRVFRSLGFREERGEGGPVLLRAAANAQDPKGGHA